VDHVVIPHHRTSSMSHQISPAVLAVVAVTASFAASSDARADYAFCSVANSSTRCDYQTYEQCQAAVSGVGADCITNPAGPPSSVASPAARKPRRDRQR
jgi:hypothetical protein